MESLSSKDVVGPILGILFLGALVFARYGRRPRVPKDRFFNCWRCKALTPHNRRTIDAWRLGKTRFFCGACHSKWLKSHPAPAEPVRSTDEYGRRGRSNPMATLAVFAAMAVIALLARSCS